MQGLCLCGRSLTEIILNSEYVCMCVLSVARWTVVQKSSSVSSSAATGAVSTRRVSTSDSTDRQDDLCQWLPTSCCTLITHSLTHAMFLFLQCFDTVGWVIWPVKTRPRYDLWCVWWDVKPYSIYLSRQVLLLSTGLVETLMGLDQGPRLKNWGVHPPCLSSSLPLFPPSRPPSSFLCLVPPSFIPFLPSFPFFGGPPLETSWASGGALWASPAGPGRARQPNGFDAFGGENRALVSCDSGVEEVDKWRTSVICHNVDENFGGVGHPQPDFWGIETPNDTHSGWSALAHSEDHTKGTRCYDMLRIYCF